MTTHELGHNFGAEHDPDNIAYCAPSDDQGGKFVMYPIAVSGDHVNNKVKNMHFNDDVALSAFVSMNSSVATNYRFAVPPNGCARVEMLRVTHPSNC